MGIVRFALRFPHTFYVVAALILFLGIAAIRQVVRGEDKIQRRYLVIVDGHADKPGPIVQVQLK